jgi:aspartyl-tRNA(Asn)/glutamyl-tRNA(Gln) amidotransferase subunit A
MVQKKINERGKHTKPETSFEKTAIVNIDLSKLNEKYHAFTQLCDVHGQKGGKLSKYTISLKDAILLKGVESAACSDILRGYKPVFNATAVEKILEKGGRIIGKTAQDEFGFGSFAVNVGKSYAKPLNPTDTSRCTGGSSGGAAAAAKLILNHISISESTGGSIVTPAAFCGVVGLCPTYGRVSRNGLISYASSLDKIGVMSQNVKDCAMMLGIISGVDDKDETSADVKSEEFEKYAETCILKLKGKRIGVLRQKGVSPEIEQRFMEIIEELKKQGAITETVNLPFTEKYGLAAYYIIAMSEASTHLACLCGLRYGAYEELGEEGYDEYFTKVRTNNFNEETKRRIMLGTFSRMTGYRGKYYMKALKVRSKIIQEYKEIFKQFDALTMPTTPFVAPKFEDIDKLTPAQQYAFDFITVGPNLAGLPHITVPIEKGKFPIGIMIVANHFKESEVITIGAAVEEVRN